MDSPNPEGSPAISGRGIKSILKKARQGIKGNASSVSIGTEDSAADSPDTTQVSLNSSIEKFGIRTSNEAGREDGDSSSSGPLSKLIPGKLKKRRKKGNKQQSVYDAKGLSPKQSLGSRDNFGETLSPGERDDDGTNSLLTYDSDDQSPLSSPPPLVSHLSHIGYLTSSSPAIQTATEIVSPQLNNLGAAVIEPGTGSAAVPSLNVGSHSDTLASESAASFDRHDSTLSVDSTGSGKSNRSRAISPGTKIKDILKPGARKKDTTRDGSPEKPSPSPSFSSGNTLSGFFNKDRRGSFSSRRASKDPEGITNPPLAIQTQNVAARASNTDIPALNIIPHTPPSTVTKTPATVVTPPTPVDRSNEESFGSPVRKPVNTSGGPSSNIVTSASGNMISHRRVRSDSASRQPSKLSNSIAAPLTPMEEEKTTGSRTTSGSQAGGFFSSVFVAAQNAANTFTNTLNTNQTRSRSNTDESDSKATEKAPTTAIEDEVITSDTEKQSTIDTIGTGNLSLSHLGISTEPSATSPSFGSSFATRFGSQSDVSANGNSMHNNEAAARAENLSAAQAVSAAYTESTAEDATPIIEDTTSALKARSTYEPSIAGDKTPPNGSILESEGGLWRSGSVRSRVGKVARRHRNSSGATTGTGIAAALGQAHAGLSNPALNGSTPKMTGFAVASKKRNREFHQLFRSVPEDDYLIEDYSCALQRDIILAGRIYISEGHICFSSNILGWVTTLVLSFDEVVSVEKENTAMVFPNAIAIQTLQARHTFRSLLSREATYDLLIGIWKISHPSLNHSQNGARLVDGGLGDKTEKAEPSGSDNGSIGSEEEEEIYDEDEEQDEGANSFVDTQDGSVAGSEPPEYQSKSVIRKASALGVAVGQAHGSVPTVSDTKAAEKAVAAAAASSDFPGPATHAPTECTDAATHYEKILKDEVIPAPLGKIYSMVFGAASGGFMTKWFVDEVKVTELEWEDDKKGLTLENPKRIYSYIKPLSGSFGPKQTKCVTTEVLDAFDLERAVSVTVSTVTPDVPNGNLFTTKTKYCLSWAPGNATRFFANCTIEWSGKSWLKIPIEKGSNEGQTVYANDLVKALKASVSSRPRAGTSTSKGKKGTIRRKRGDLEASKASLSSSIEKSEPQPSSWGILKPLHGPLQPILDIMRPLLTSNSLIGFLLFLLIVTYFRNSRVRAPSLSQVRPGYPTPWTNPKRMAAYEEIWGGEESKLWEWLEDRTRLRNGEAYPAGDGMNGDKTKKAKKERAKVLRGKEGEEIARREVEWAIKVTEEKLKVLRGIVEGEKGAEGGRTLEMVD